jgi:hypothetical protein
MKNTMIALMMLILTVDANPIAADPLSRFKVERQSQHNEDLFVFQEFYQSNVSKMIVPWKTYIEAGAYDGRDMSNTWAFNKAFGWTGILIEASPLLYASLIRVRRNSRDVLIHGALCSPHDAKNNVSYHFVVNREGKTAVGGLWELMDEGFKKHFYKHLMVDGIALHNYPVVKCISLGAELTTRNIKHVDYFSLDIEGAELDFLTHFCKFLQKGNITVDIFSVEGYGDSVTAKDEKVMALLGSVGYTFVGHGTKQPAYGWGSMWFLRNNSAVHEDYFRIKH